MSRFWTPLRRVRTQVFFTISNFSFKQKVIFVVLAIGMSFGAIGSLVFVSKTYSVTVPAFGGTYTEGVVGTPRFINPVLATSTVDQDLSRLAYAGLIKKDGESYTGVLAERYEISDDGTTYTFTLRNDTTFHDGAPVTAHDVVFTIETIQNSSTKSPLRPEWLGVTLTALDDTTVQFVLDMPYAGFLDNAMVGIIPQHIWETVAPDQMSFSDVNIRPIGAGAYQFSGLKKSRSGIPTEIDLKPFKDYAEGRPYLKNIHIKFYANNQELVSAFSKGSISGIYTTTPADLEQTINVEKKSITVHTAPLPRVFSLFFNTGTNEAFLRQEVLRAIELAIPKEAMVKHLYSDYGTPLCGPLPPEAIGYQACSPEDLIQQDRITASRESLGKAGYTYDEASGFMERNGTPFAFSIATVNTPEMKEAAEFIQESLLSAGMNVQLQIFEPGNFDQDVIRPRNYEMLLFGQIIEHDSDLAALWHSNGRNDPGLNIGLYTNAAADTILDDSIRTADVEVRKQQYSELYEEFSKQIPALFLYSPEAAYITASNIEGIDFDHLTDASERFRDVGTWYKRTERLWNIFITNKHY